MFKINETNSRAISITLRIVSKFHFNYTANLNELISIPPENLWFSDDFKGDRS